MQIKVSWKDTFIFYWSFLWRAVIYGAVGGAILGFIFGFAAGMLGHLDHASSWGSLGGVVAALPSSLLGLKHALGTNINRMSKYYCTAQGQGAS